MVSNPTLSHSLIKLWWTDVNWCFVDTRLHCLDLQMQFMLLFSRQGKLRLQKWYVAHPDKLKKKITRELITTVLARKPKMCSFLEWKDVKIVYKRCVYLGASCSLFYISCTTFSLLANCETSAQLWWRVVCLDTNTAVDWWPVQYGEDKWCYGQCLPWITPWKQ